MTVTHCVYSSKHQTARSVELRELMAIPEERRDVSWLRRMLQFAIELELSTIPPYLVAMWSIKDISAPTSLFLFSIVLQEMLHMGIACNLLNAIDGQVCIDSPDTVPQYPCCLPGGVRPGLIIQLQAISKPLIETFMEIERPECGAIGFFQGQTYPTIGAFYSAILDAFSNLCPSDVTGQRQIELPAFQLYAIRTIRDAQTAIQLIKEQGEGTSSSPLYGSSADDKSHYYLFGEIYYEKSLTEISPGHWSYSGDDRPFPLPHEIYSMAPIPAEGYVESRAFDEKYSAMLHELQSAWQIGGTNSTHLTNAFALMRELGKEARTLMQTEIMPGGATFGPAFRLV